MNESRLILLPNWLGDAVMAEPAIRGMTEELNDLPLIAAGPAVATSVLKGIPGIEHLITINDRGLLGPFRAGKSLRAYNPQEVILFRNSTRSALVAKASGARTCIGYRKDGRGRMLTTAITPPPKSTPISAVHYYADLVEQGLGVSISDRTPRFTIDTHERERAENILQGITGPIVGMVPGGSKLPKRWPPNRFAHVAQVLHESYGASTILIGSPDEREVLKSVQESAGNPEWMCNVSERGLTLGDLRGVISSLSLLITNDTGPRHIAAACGTPTVALFGPTDHRWTILPDVQERMLISEPFLDDDHLADHHPQTCRIDRISTGDVIFHAQSILGEPK